MHLVRFVKIFAFMGGEKDAGKISPASFVYPLFFSASMNFSNSSGGTGREK